MRKDVAIIGVHRPVNDCMRHELKPSKDHELLLESPFLPNPSSLNGLLKVP